jgi:hypothetical protein
MQGNNSQMQQVSAVSWLEGDMKMDEKSYFHPQDL